MRDALTLERMLQQDARHFDFFQALRLIDCAYPERPRLGTSPSPRDDAVRLAQDAELIFHPSALNGYTPGADGQPGRLAVNFLGLLGPNGPLPTHLTAYVRERERHANDRTPARFLDLFHHRMLSLFYRAWAAAQPVVSADRADGDRFPAYVGSFFGLGSPAMRERDALPDHARLHFAGLLAAPTRHAGGLRLILTQFFGVPVDVQPWRGHWLTLPVDAQTRLGTARLGVSSVVGTQVWDCQHKFRIVIGPLGYRDFQRFLPCASCVTGCATTCATRSTGTCRCICGARRCLRCGCVARRLRVARAWVLRTPAPEVVHVLAGPHGLRAARRSMTNIGS